MKLNFKSGTYFIVYFNYFKLKFYTRLIVVLFKTITLLCKKVEKN